MKTSIFVVLLFAPHFSVSHNAFYVLNLTKNSIKYEFSHYDLILSSNDPSSVTNEESTLINSRLRSVQYTFVRIEQFRLFVKKFRKNRGQYGRTMLFLLPANSTQFAVYMELVRKLYKQPRNDIYVDSRLLTFIRWPIGESEKESRSFLLSFAKYFYLNIEIYVLFGEETGSYKIYEIYSIKNKNFVNQVPPECDPERCYCPKFPSLVHRRKNLQGVNLIISALNNTQSEHCNTFTTTQGNVTVFEDNHSCNQVLWDYQRLLNFSISARAESQYIWHEAGSTLGGMGKVLQTGEADVVITATYLLDYRLKYLTALLPVGNEPILAYFIQPAASTVTNIYNLPFSTRVWKAVFYLQGIIFVTSAFFAYFGARIHTDPKWWSSQNYFWIICVSCQKGWYFTPRSASGKILLLSTIGVSLVGYTAYSGALISGLAYEPVPVSSVQDLVAHDFKFAFDPNVYNPFFTDHASTDWLADILKVNQVKESFVNDTRAVQTVFEQKVALLTTTRNFISAYYTLHQNDSYMCETVYKISLSKRFLQSSFFISKGSPLKELLNSRLTILLENGLKHRYWRYYYQRNNSVECSEKEFSYRLNLGLNDVISAYFLLIAGFLAAIAAFLIERKVDAVCQYFLTRKIYNNWAHEIIF